MLDAAFISQKVKKKLQETVTNKMNKYKNIIDII